MKPDLTAYDRWSLASEYGEWLRGYQRRNPPAPKSGRRISRSDAPSPQPQVPTKGLAPSAAE